MTRLAFTLIPLNCHLWKALLLHPISLPDNSRFAAPPEAVYSLFVEALKTQTSGRGRRRCRHRQTAHRFMRRRQQKQERRARRLASFYPYCLLSRLLLKIPLMPLILLGKHSHYKRNIESLIRDNLTVKPFTHSSIMLLDEDKLKYAFGIYFTSVLTPQAHLVTSVLA